MKKVISLVLAIIMVFSVIAIMPSASATETVYKAGSKIQAVWKFPNAGTFAGVQFYFNYSSTLELVEGSAAIPNISGGSIYFLEQPNDNRIFAMISDVKNTYSLGEDDVLLTAEFNVLEDTAESDLFDPYMDQQWFFRFEYNPEIQDDDYVDVDMTNELEINVLSEPTTAAPTVALMGTLTNWDPGQEMTGTDGVYTTTVALEADTYEFKVKVNDTWYGNGGTIEDTTEKTAPGAGWDMFDGADNCKLQASGGIYTFTFDTTTNKLVVLAELDEQPTEPEPTETEPTVAPESKSFYFINSLNWAEVSAYVWNKETNANPAGWPGTTMMKTGDTYKGYDVYSIEVPVNYDMVVFNNNDQGLQAEDQSIEFGKYYDAESSKWLDTIEELKNGIVEEDGALYYYKDGARFYAGLIIIDGDFYYVNSSCEVIADRVYYISKHNYLLPCAHYEFDETGKMINPPVIETSDAGSSDGQLKNGIVKEDDGLYYYKDGERYYAGLIIIDGDYYYVNSSCQVITAKVYYISKNNDILPCAAYTFDINGKMLNPPVEESTTAPDDTVVKDGFVKENNVIYYYVNGVKNYAGLIMVDGYYYYVNSSCVVTTNKAYYISKNNDLLPCASYRFDETGKMIDPPVEESTEAPDDTVVKNGFVKENGITYYYVNGVKTYAGLIEIDGYYYYVNSSCVVITGKAYYISKHNDLEEVGTYHFDADGKMCDVKTKVPIVADNSAYIPV